MISGCEDSFVPVSTSLKNEIGCYEDSCFPASTSLKKMNQ